MIDTHCHIDDEIYVHDLQAVVERQRMAGVEAILVPGINIQSIESVMHVCKAFPQYLYPALGLHPEEVNNDWRDNLLQIREAINRIGCYPKALEGLIAIGEIHRTSEIGSLILKMLIVLITRFVYFNTAKIPILTISVPTNMIFFFFSSFSVSKFLVAIYTVMTLTLRYIKV